jgi:hypothetical protein
MPDLTKHWHLPLHCRVGIAAGEVVVMESRSGYAAEVTIIGQSVNLASRIQAFGQPGDLLVSAAVHHELAGAIRATALGTFKGIEEAIGVWRVDGLRESAEGPRMRFAGRDAERGQLLRLVERVQSERTAMTAALIGEAGIGKTRLLDEMATTASQRGWSVQRGRYVDFGLPRRAQGLHAIASGLLGLDPCRLMPACASSPRSARWRADKCRQICFRLCSNCSPPSRPTRAGAPSTPWTRGNASAACARPPPASSETRRSARRSCC